MITVTATIRVPDIGTFRYVGRTPDDRDRPVLAAALKKATLRGEKRDNPYEYGVRMYARYGEAGSERLRETFSVVDDYTATARMTLVETEGDGPSERCVERMRGQTRDNVASIVSILNEYSGVYVESYEIRSFLPAPALKFLRN